MIETPESFSAIFFSVMIFKTEIQGRVLLIGGRREYSKTSELLKRVSEQVEYESPVGVALFL